jgi:pSer/pThr/pTyr-binding forkhead associated (FHA) protein
MPIHGIIASMLARQYVLLRDKFVERYPNPWLIWVASGLPPTSHIDQVDATLPSQQETPEQPPPGDALCFALPVDSNPAASLSVGRSPDNQIVVADMTISRMQLHVRLDASGSWFVDRAPNSQAVQYRGKTLEPHSPVEWIDGESLTVGSVILWLETPETFLKRMKAEAAKVL